MLKYLFITAFLVGLSGALVPGPLLTVTITESARRGFGAAPLLILGHAILEVALIIIFIEGFSSIFASTMVNKIIAVMGGFFLIWMGWGMVRGAYFKKINLGFMGKVEEGSDARRISPVLAGILVSLSNPYWSIWWATVGMGYITLSLKYGAAGIITFFSGHILADLSWYSLVAAAVAGGRRFLSNKIYRGIIFSCGIFLVVLGVSFLYYGFVLKQ